MFDVSVRYVYNWYVNIPAGKKPAKTSLSWLTGLSWFKLEVDGFSWTPILAKLVKLVSQPGQADFSWSVSLTS